MFEEGKIFKWDITSREEIWKSPFIRFTTSSNDTVCGRFYMINSCHWTPSNKIAYFSVLADLHWFDTLINVEVTISISGETIFHQSKMCHDPRSLVFEKVEKISPLFSRNQTDMIFQLEFKEINEETSKNSICESLRSAEESKVDSIYEKLLFDVSIHDIQLIVGEKQYPAHKVVLAANSPVFHRMFSHQMKETLSKEVEIKEMIPEVLEELLKYMYTRKVDKFENLAGELLIAANRYEMEEFKFICERELMKGLNVENVLKFIILADTHNAVKLKKHGFSVVMSNFAQVVEKDEFKDFANSHPNVLVDLTREMSGKCDIKK